LDTRGTAAHLTSSNAPTRVVLVAHPGHGRRRGAGRRPLVAAIAEWAADTPSQSGPRSAPATTHSPAASWVPTETTIRRTLGRLDAHALAAAAGDWLVARDRHDHPAPAQRPRRRAAAIDGKTPRGAHPPDGHSRPVHLLAAMEHTGRVVLAASGMPAIAAGNPACPGPGDRRALEAGFAACPPGAAWMTPE
jgi:hypothetical protein